jgi:dTDP-glucose 4,6-dehydratase
MAKLLVIGGSGFFGKSILDGYRRGLLEPWGITSIAIMARHASQLQISVPALIGPNVELINGDITSCNSLVKADYVIHAAASTDARDYLSRPAEEKRNILLGTSHFCELASQYFQKSKIVYVSSGAVYGQQSATQEKLAENDRFESLESMALSKRDYAAAKRDAEALIKILGGSGVNVSIARCFAFVGPYLPRDQHFAVGNFIADILNGGPIRIKADHLVLRSYLHADDLVNWLMAIVANAKPNCPIYNVGSDEAVSIATLAQSLAKKYGLKVEACKLVDPRVDRYIPSIAKAAKELDLKVTIDLYASIEKTLKTLTKDENVKH